MPRKKGSDPYIDPEFPLTHEIEERKREEQAEVQAKAKAKRKKKWLKIRWPLFVVVDGLIVSSLLYAVAASVKVGSIAWYFGVGAAIFTIGLTAVGVRILVSALKK